MNGSITAVDESGISSMSLSLMGWKPRMDEPSKPTPSSKLDSSSLSKGMLVCCHLPGRSMNLRSTITAPFFLPSSRASLGPMLHFSLRKMRTTAADGTRTS